MRRSPSRSHTAGPCGKPTGTGRERLSTFLCDLHPVSHRGAGGSHDGTGNQYGVTFYCATFVVGSGAFNVLVATIARCPGVDMEAVRRIRRGFRITFTIYVAATLIALVAPWVALALNIAVRVHLLRIHYQAAKLVP